MYKGYTLFVPFVVVLVAVARHGSFNLLTFTCVGGLVASSFMVSNLAVRLTQKLSENDVDAIPISQELKTYITIRSKSSIMNGKLNKAMIVFNA